MFGSPKEKKKLFSDGQIADINDLKFIKEDDLRKYQKAQDDDLKLKRKKNSLLIRNVGLWFGLGFSFLIMTSFFICSFLSWSGLALANRGLENYFMEGVKIVISFVVGFTLGIFYDKSVL